MHTQQRIARPQQAVAANRRSRRVDIPSGALAAADSLAVVVWLLALLGVPAITDSARIQAWVVSLGAWVAAAAISRLLTQLRPALAWSGARKLLVTGLAAVAMFYAAELVHPNLPLPQPYAAVIPPIALIATIHGGWFLVSRLVLAHRANALLLAPSSTLPSLNSRITRYEESLGITIAGVMGWDDHLPLLSAPLPSLFDQILSAMKDCQATVLVLSVSSITSMSDMQDLRWQLENEGMRLDVVIEPTCLGPTTIQVTSAPGVTLLRAVARRDTVLEAILKRAFDVVVSSILIVLLTPLWITVTHLIRRQDGGPAFFLQERVGRDGRTFPMVKFRTMVTNAELLLAELGDDEPRNDVCRDGDTGVLYKRENDSRITPLGRILRRTSIDELPQLFNVWWGHMSLVGPRPPLPREVAQYMPRVMRKFNVRPGMTGLWQVSGRSNLSWEESVRLDLHYVEHRSLAFDIAILLKTIPAVFLQEGAY